MNGVRILPETQVVRIGGAVCDGLCATFGCTLCLRLCCDGGYWQAHPGFWESSKEDLEIEMGKKMLEGGKGSGCVDIEVK